MLLKWIVCSVPDDTKEAFSIAQTKWAGLADIKGFVGQLGGWDLKSENEACVLGIWQHAEAYNTFMAEHHDRIFQDNEQAKTYRALNTVLLQPVYKMPGAYKDMSDSLDLAKAIRVADCRVRPDREKHFVDVQREIWIPGMEQAVGMLAGSFNKVVGDSTRYIVTSFWDSLESHDKYVKVMLPALREAADVVQDVQHINGRLIIINSDWLVMPRVGSFPS
jgi:heme-degrading monooxygenase HmoA